MKRWMLLIGFLISVKVFAQDPMLQKPDRSLSDEVSALTEAYNRELGLDTDQLGLFEMKLEEFLIRRKKIESLLEGEEKLETLYEMQAEETLEMQDILTHYQFVVYQQVKPSIQPIEVVKTTTKVLTTKE